MFRALSINNFPVEIVEGIQSISIDSNQYYLYVTSLTGIFRLNLRNSDIIKLAQNYKWNNIHYALSDSNSDIYVLDDHRLSVIHNYENQNTSFLFDVSHVREDSKELKFNHPTSLCFGKNEQLIYITDNGNNMIRTINKTYNNQVQTIWKDIIRPFSIVINVLETFLYITSSVSIEKIYRISLNNDQFKIYFGANDGIISMNNQ